MERRELRRRIISARFKGKTRRQEGKQRPGKPSLMPREIVKPALNAVGVFADLPVRSKISACAAWNVAI